MGGRKDIGQDGEKTRFSSENQPEKRGRKPSKLKKFIKEYDIPLSDVQTLINNMMFTYTFDEINELAKKSGSLPVGLGIIIKGLADDVHTGKISIFDKLLDRSFGKTAPVQTAAVEVERLSEDAKKRIALLFQEETAQSCMPKIIAQKNIEERDDDI